MKKKIKNISLTYSQVFIFPFIFIFFDAKNGRECLPNLQACVMVAGRFARERGGVVSVLVV
jgi:hypothetical protein